MDRATITWDDEVLRLVDLATSEHPLLGERGYFALVSARLDEAADVWRDLELLYIGQAFHESLRERIAALGDDHAVVEAAAAERSGAEVIAMIGVMTDSSLGRITQGFWVDVESCLVARNRPRCNAAVEAYTGRKISLLNDGAREPLQARIWTKTPVA